MAVKRKPIYVLVLPQFEDFFHSFYTGEITKGVNLAASRLNVDFLVHITDRRNHEAWLDPTLLDRKYVDGILFADIDSDLEIVKKAIRRSMPCLVLNNIIDEPVNYIAINNYQAAVEVVEAFVKQGHELIATIAGDLNTQAGRSRLDGYRDALKKHGLGPNKAYIKYGGFLRTPARQAAGELLRLKNRPTAVFAASDVMAMEVLDVARLKKVSIPSELAVCGFDDNPLRQNSSIGLATVSQPLIEMGRLGLERLYQISQGHARLPVKEVLEARLIKAESMGKQDHENQRT
ncbi:MAG: substrate-binding domain-containing protein [Candidatus Omnitrophica bacterium]|nr:substrate-binding domain-containing protein [Candidatus Omnitrophota bacterium]MDE2010156.1 substrate-binding domain-containing protein [Candidatus Omnitrophota bacterium]MDE2214890.1 substrate-binding domain-containing protein [Candidatus Omnitrophota bacterium]MDE2230780.1 substrate-binding domain-containing protein [Candidatus Omnitrophota bacterium]